MSRPNVLFGLFYYFIIVLAIFFTRRYSARRGDYSFDGERAATALHATLSSTQVAFLEGT